MVPTCEDVNGSGTSGGDPAWIDAALHWTGRALEGAGVVVIVLGALIALAISLARARREGWTKHLYHEFRTSFARAILLGLEFLVAGDIIGTVAVEPTLRNLSVLGLIVVIRTFLSFSLEVEIHGRWPWQGKSDRASA